MRQTARAVLGLAAALALSPAVAHAGQVVRLDKDNWSLVPGGKEVDAIYGDFLLKNDKVVAVIGSANPNRHANLTTTNVQGAVIDFALLSTNNDQLTAFQPHAFAGVAPKAGEGPKDGAYNNPGPAADRIDVVKADGNEVVLRATRRPTDAYPVEVVTEYTLKDGDQHIGVVTKRKNVGDKPVTVRLTDRLKHEKPAVLPAPGEHFVVTSYDRYFGGAYGLVRTDGKPLAIPQPPVVAAQQRGALGLVDYPGLTSGKAAGSVELAAGQEVVVSRLLVAGNDAAEVQLSAMRATKAPLEGGLHATIVDDKKKPVAGAAVTVYPAAAWEKAATPAARKALPAAGFAFDDRISPESLRPYRRTFCLCPLRAGCRGV